MRTLLLLLAPLLFGCVGSVTLDISSEESFSVGSASWLELKKDEGSEHALIVTNRSDTCEALQGFLPSATTRINDWLFTDLADCSEGEAMFAALGEESAEIWAADDNWMWIYLNEGSDERTKPATGDYVSAGDPGFLLDIAWFRENRYVDAANNIDDVCVLGMAGGIFAEMDPYRTILDEEVGGDLELTVDGDSVVATGKLDLRTEDLEDAGDVEFEFTATHCPVDLTDNEFVWMP